MARDPLGSNIIDKTGDRDRALKYLEAHARQALIKAASLLAIINQPASSVCPDRRRRLRRSGSGNRKASARPHRRRSIKPALQRIASVAGHPQQQSARVDGNTTTSAAGKIWWKQQRAANLWRRRTQCIKLEAVRRRRPARRGEVSTRLANRVSRGSAHQEPAIVTFMEAALSLSRSIASYIDNKTVFARISS